MKNGVTTTLITLKVDTRVKWKKIILDKVKESLIPILRTSLSFII